MDKKVVDLGIDSGKVAAIAPSLAGSSDDEIDLSGKSLFPGFIDAHVHFNEPGREHWEGFATGSAALAAGGGTTFCDMPLNSTPPVVDGGSFREKREIGLKKSILDFALWGGLIPGNSDQIPDLAREGAAGLKAFMADSGLEEFPRITPKDLQAGMEMAVRFQLPVAVHAESQEFLDSLPDSGETGVRGFLCSRPIEAEVEAIQIACELAGETGCQLHVVHVSSAAGVRVIDQAKKSGVNVTAETCPHYLFFDENDMIEMGAAAKCAPPLRPKSEVTALHESLQFGLVDSIGSDHSPSDPKLKSGDFSEVWGGISGCQHAFPMFLDRYPDLSELLTKNPGSSHRGGRSKREYRNRKRRRCNSDRFFGRSNGGDR